MSAAHSLPAMVDTGSLATFVVTDEPGFLALHEYDRVRIVTPEVFLEHLNGPAGG